MPRWQVNVRQARQPGVGAGRGGKKQGGRDYIVIWSRYIEYQNLSHTQQIVVRDLNLFIPQSTAFHL